MLLRDRYHFVRDKHFLPKLRLSGNLIVQQYLKSQYKLRTKIKVTLLVYILLEFTASLGFARPCPLNSNGKYFT